VKGDRKPRRQDFLFFASLYSHLFREKCGRTFTSECRQEPQRKCTDRLVKNPTCYLKTEGKKYEIPGIFYQTFQGLELG